jgi:hypothetical protein
VQNTKPENQQSTQEDGDTKQPSSPDWQFVPRELSFANEMAGHRTDIDPGSKPSQGDNEKK